MGRDTWSGANTRVRSIESSGLPPCPLRRYASADRRTPVPRKDLMWVRTALADEGENHGQVDVRLHEHDRRARGARELRACGDEAVPGLRRHDEARAGVKEKLGIRFARRDAPECPMPRGTRRKRISATQTSHTEARMSRPVDVVRLDWSDRLFDEHV